MNRPVKLDAVERIELVYRNAEIKARARQDFCGEIGLDTKQSARASTPDRQLMSIAKQELERRMLRVRYLPFELSADSAWTVLLELFMNGSQPCSVYAVWTGVQKGPR